MADWTASGKYFLLFFLLPFPGRCSADIARKRPPDLFEISGDFRKFRIRKQIAINVGVTDRQGRCTIVRIMFRTFFPSLFSTFLFSKRLQQIVSNFVESFPLQKVRNQVFEIELKFFVRIFFFGLFALLLRMLSSVGIFWRRTYRAFGLFPFFFIRTFFADP